MEFAASTTSSVLISHMVAICLIYPGEMEKVQSELDGVVGGQRLPSFDDQEVLPFTIAFITEFIRVVSILPFTVPRSTSKEDFYEGYYVPKDAVILPNQWAINRDPGIYKVPKCFRSEHWIEYPHLPRPALFGLGERACPGPCAMGFQASAGKEMIYTGKGC